MLGRFFRDCASAAGPAALAPWRKRRRFIKPEVSIAAGALAGSYRAASGGIILVRFDLTIGLPPHDLKLPAGNSSRLQPCGRILDILGLHNPGAEEPRFAVPGIGPGSEMAFGSFGGHALNG